MKVSGAELKQFMDEAWPGDDWLLDDEFPDDIPDDVLYDISDVYLLSFSSDKELRLQNLIKKFREKRDYTMYSVMIQKDKEKIFLDLINHPWAKIRRG